MSKKVTIASVICLVLGGISIPGGIILNNYITDLTYNSMPKGLLGIKDQGIPIIEDSIFQLGPASAFEIIKEKGIETSGLLVNATIFMNQIHTVDDTEVNLLGPIINALYWDWQNGTHAGAPTLTFSTLASLVGYPSIKGISEWYGADLNFTIRNWTTYEDIWGGVDRLKFGVNTTGWWGDRLPGIYEDTYKRVGQGDWPPDNITDSVSTIDANQDRGFGVIELMELIENANKTQILEMAGPNGYNLTNPFDNFLYKGVNYTKLEILYFYINDYYYHDVFGDIITKFNSPPPPNNPLWDAYPQYRMQSWNGNHTDYIDLEYYSFIEQWAKCISYDGGTDLHISEPNIPPGTKGLETGGPHKDSGIPMQAAIQLWNASNELSFVNFPNGIEKWYEANTSTIIYDEILNEFSQYPGFDYENSTYGEFGWGSNETDLNLLLDWLWGNGGGWNQGSFSEYLLPILIMANYNATIEEYSFQILLEQWANGTIMGYGLYSEGFPLPLGFADIYGFEIGYQGLNKTIIPTNMSLVSALALWNTSSSNSLVTKKGLKKWLIAVEGDMDVYTELKTANSLEDESMNLLLRWIPKFQHKVMPYLAQYQYDLPTNSIAFANAFQLGGFVIGIVTLGLGLAGMIYNFLFKKKRIKPLEQ